MQAASNIVAVKHGNGNVAGSGASLVANHAFLDGNKRIGMYVMLTFLEVNGIRFECTDEEIVRAGLSLADGSMDYGKLLVWIREHEMTQEAK